MTTFTREDFEHAARAVGLTGYAWSDEYLCMVKPVGYAADSPLAGAVYTWAPRYDDGDALRLARHLRMTIADDPMKTCWSVGAVVNGQFTWLASSEDQRHAIFCAAIAIGKATP